MLWIAKFCSLQGRVAERPVLKAINWRDDVNPSNVRYALLPLEMCRSPTIVGQLSGGRVPARQQIIIGHFDGGTRLVGLKLTAPE